MEDPIEKKTIDNVLNKEPVTPEDIVNVGLWFDRYFGNPNQSTPVYKDLKENEYMFKHEGDMYTLIATNNPAYRANQSFWKLIHDNFGF